MRLKVLCLLVVIASVSVSDVRADLITWQSSQNIFQGDVNDVSFVSTNGVLIDAVNAGVIGAANNVTVNGVTFEAAGSIQGVDGNNTNITSQSGAFTFNDQNSNTSVFNNNNPSPFAGTAVDTLLESGSFSIASVTLNDLVIGQDYEIQLFNNDARNNRSTNNISGFGNGIDTTTIAGVVERNNNAPGVTGATDVTELNVGDFIIGTFTADSTSLSFVTSSSASGVNGLGQINAIQLRDVTVAAVPEPSAVALLCVGLAGLVVRRRRRRR